MAKQYALHVRSQKSHGSSKGFGGPDTYVAVTIAPEGVLVPQILNPKWLEARGIELRRFGEGYKGHSGPKSKLGQAIAAAKQFIEEQQTHNDEA